MYDVIIIGGGPAGLSASIYAARFNLKTLVLSSSYGGQIAESHLVENYPGIKSISGMELIEKMTEQAKSLGVEIKSETAEKISGNFKINDKYESKTLILATGMERRKLNAKGESNFTGKGVSYCATCDAAFFQEKVVAVIGGNDSAARAAQLLSEYCKKVTIIYRKSKMRCEPALLSAIESNNKINFEYNSNIQEIKGTKNVEKVLLDTGKELKLDGIFIEIGAEPSQIFIKELNIETNNGFIKINEDMSTNIKGVYAAGDITTASNQMWQVITAASEGAVAANSVYEYLKDGD